MKKIPYQSRSYSRLNASVFASIALAPLLSAQSYSYIHDADWTGFVEDAFFSTSPFDETHPDSDFNIRSLNFVAPVARGVAFQLRGGHTMTDGANSFDLSAAGSSVTINTRQHFFGSGNFLNAPGDPARNIHMYQLGLSSNTDAFGAAGNESLFVAYDYKERVGSDFGGEVRYYGGNLDVLDHNGYDTTIDDQWNHTPLATLATGVTARVYQRFTNTAIHSIELTYTNLGEGRMGIGMSVRELYYSPAWDILNEPIEDNLLLDQNIVNNYVEVDHDFTDLSSLRPAFGLAIDSEYRGMGSGHNWSWDPAFAPDPAPIPEPSAALLLGLSSIALLRRKRAM